MQIKVDQYIQELLYENEAVNIPGLGGLVTEYQPAQIDHVQAKIRPPAREVSLNTNLPIDDGLLTQRVADAYELSGLEAEQLIREYVEKLQESLDKGEIVAIEGVGRLYKNHTGELHFMTDHTNFDTSVYGLPAVASPAIHHEKKPKPLTTTNSTSGTLVPSESTDDTWAVISGWFQQNLWVVVTAAMLVFIFTVWLLFFKYAPEDPTSGLSEVKELPEDRVNVSPNEIEDDELVMEEPTAPEENSEIFSEEENAVPPQPIEEDPDDFDTEAPTVAPEQSVALIRIGIFGNRANVQKLVQRIYDEGFEPYTREKGSLIEVGVQFTYDDQQEVRANLRTIRRKFEEKAKVVE